MDLVADLDQFAKNEENPGIDAWFANRPDVEKVIVTGLFERGYKKITLFNWLGSTYKDAFDFTPDQWRHYTDRLTRRTKRKTA